MNAPLKNAKTLGSIALLALLGGACEMSEGYKKAPTATNSTFSNSLKMGALEQKVGGCDRGLFVVDALKDYSDKGTGGVTIHSAGFVTEKAGEAQGKAHMALSLLTNENAKALTAPKGYAAPKVLDLGAEMPLTLVGDGATSSEFHAGDHGAEVSASRGMAVASGEATESSSLTRNSKGAYVTSQVGVPVKNVTLNQLSRTASAQTAGVGPIGSVVLGSAANKIGAGTFRMPSDVGTPTISANTGEITVTAARGAAQPGDVTYLEVEVRNYPPTGSANDWRAVYRAEESGVGNTVTVKIPAEGKLKEGDALIDVSRVLTKSARAADAEGGNVCVSTKVTARKITSIGKPPAPAAK